MSYDMLEQLAQHRKQKRKKGKSLRLMLKQQGVPRTPRYSQIYEIFQHHPEGSLELSLMSEEVPSALHRSQSLSLEETTRLTEDTDGIDGVRLRRILANKGL